MGRRSIGTPRSRVRNALRMMWLRSRERAAAIKREQNTCQRCGKKGSVAKGREVKTQVHHTLGIGNWEKVIDLIYAELLCDPSLLKVLCVDCHGQEKV